MDSREEKFENFEASYQIFCLSMSTSVQMSRSMDLHKICTKLHPVYARIAVSVRAFHSERWGKHNVRTEHVRTFSSESEHPSFRPIEI